MMFETLIFCLKLLQLKCKHQYYQFIEAYIEPIRKKLP